MKNPCNECLIQTMCSRMCERALPYFQTITFVESISKQITNIDLQSAKTVEVYAAVDGNWFAMVHYPIRQLVSEVDNMFKRNETAAFAEFKADEATRRLDASLEDKPLVTTVDAAAE